MLSFFRAPPGYTVVFTANATGALKLVGEAFPFAAGSSYVLGADAHNSVHGIRRFAAARGAGVHYIEATPQGGVDEAEAQVRTRSARWACQWAQLTGLRHSSFFVLRSSCIFMLHASSGCGSRNRRS